jgi:molybdenum cofactor cytidylyltransferase
MSLGISAILLAAGSSRRMGQSKQLLPLEGKLIIEHCLDGIIRAGISDIVVVLGRNSGILSKALGSQPVKIAFNAALDSEMADSVRVGLSSVEGSASGILVSLSDHPLVSPETVKTLVNLHAATPDKILIPGYSGRKGHPVLFPRSVIDEIFSSGTLRDIVAKEPARTQIVEITDEGVIIDIDTMEDYNRVVERLATLK